MAGGAVLVLATGTIGTWKVMATATPEVSGLGRPSASAGTSQVSGGAATTDLAATTTAGTPGTTGTAPTVTGPSASPPVGTTGTTPTTRAARLRVETTSLAFGADRSAVSTRRPVTLTNDGGRALTWTATRSGAGFSTSPGSGTLGPGQSTTLTITLTRAELPEGTVRNPPVGRRERRPSSPSTGTPTPTPWS
jgi:hypothetical protein